MSDSTTDAKLQVLFVDDETNVLNGLRRLLRSKRDQWTVHYATSGAAAIEQMQSITFDVIVSDMRMPEMDGAELLMAAKKHAPSALRCVLSGQADRDQIMRVIESAHQYVSKPCDTLVLEKVVSRAEATKENLRNPKLRNQIAAIHSLPVHPTNWHALLEELVSKSVSVEKIAEVVSSDVALSAKVLQLVNSSFFGQPKTIFCPRAATKLLGIDLFIELTIRRRILRSHEGPWPESFSFDSFTRESQEVARIAYDTVLETSGDVSKAQVAEQAGLFHGVGKLVIAEYFSNICHSLDPLEKHGIPSVFDATYIDIGCGLLNMWGIPAAIIDAIATSQEPPEIDAPHQINSAVQAAILHVRNNNHSAQKVMA